MALGIVLAGLIALTVKVSVRRTRAVTAAVDVASARATPPSVRPSVTGTRRPAVTAFAHPAAAHLFGRVLHSGDEEEASFEDLSVTADDGARSFAGRVFPDGRFSFRLPAGQYAVTASLGERVGIVPSVAARPDPGRELTIQLGVAAAIRGHVRGPDGVAITVRVTLAERQTWQQTVETEDGDFDVESLIPGRRYDLTFTGDDLHTITLRSVTAPAEGVAAAIDALPVLRGAVGFPAGEDCPIERVVLRESDAVPSNDHDPNNDQRDHLDQGGGVDDDCRFQLAVPDGSSRMVLVATGAGWYLEEPVSIPPIGDPDPICVNPPCRGLL